MSNWPAAPVATDELVDRLHARESRDPGPRCRSGAAARRASSDGQRRPCRCECVGPAASPRAMSPPSVLANDSAIQANRMTNSDEDDGLPAPSARRPPAPDTSRRRRQREQQASRRTRTPRRAADRARRGREPARACACAAQRLHRHLQRRLGREVRRARRRRRGGPASGRPSIQPHFRQRVLAAQQLGAQLDRLLASRRRAGSSTRVPPVSGLGCDTTLRTLPLSAVTVALMSAGGTLFRFSPAKSSTISRVSSWPAPMRVATTGASGRASESARPSGCDRCRRIRPWRASALRGRQYATMLSLISVESSGSRPDAPRLRPSRRSARPRRSGGARSALRDPRRRGNRAGAASGRSRADCCRRRR